MRTPRRRLLVDRLARRVVTGGGLAIIACIFGILLFILVEVAPLFRGAHVERAGAIPLPGSSTGAVISDEYVGNVAFLTADGRFVVVDTETRQTRLDQPVIDPGDVLTAFQTPPGSRVLAAATTDGRVLALPVDWQVDFDTGTRRVIAANPEPVTFVIDDGKQRLRSFSVRFDADGSSAAVGVLEDGRLRLIRRELRENLMTGESRAVLEERDLQPPTSPSAVVLAGDLRTVYAGTAEGDLYWWDGAGAPAEPRVMPGDVGVTALGLLIGDRSLVVGRSDGSLEIWFPVRDGDGEDFTLTRIRRLGPRPAAIRAVSPSMRNKGFVSLDASGGLALHHPTSERLLWAGEVPPDAGAVYLTPRADGLLVAAPGRIERFEVDNPHPEVGWKALFGRVWYEGYDRPRHVWQSTGGSDEFEPKLSLVPLMVGTLKGTLYSLLLALPIGVLAAMYTSQFMHPRLKRKVKPAVEVMAAMPSVVLGFLAGLWLAPRVEQVLPALALMLVVLPVIVVLTGLAWRRVPRSVRGCLLPGAEVALYMLAVAAGLWLCLWLNDFVESLFFGGSAQMWLSGTTGLRYDQRNAIVVGLAMGLAVIPVIFSIAEDAFSNVPKNMISASLALGANRWQTVTQVVLPTASPGIFSAIMIGFGRAVGETMIVLMATGNTPVLDWNPFNGFRTLSANIAVEIPEAPHGATLYRTLFLAALILFVFTFSINTAAELVRQRLRRRYAEL